MYLLSPNRCHWPIAKVKNKNLNVTEIRDSDFKNAFREIFNFTVGILSGTLTRLQNFRTKFSNFSTLTFWLHLPRKETTKELRWIIILDATKKDVTSFVNTRNLGPTTDLEIPDRMFIYYCLYYVTYHLCYIWIIIYRVWPRVKPHDVVQHLVLPVVHIRLMSTVDLFWSKSIYRASSVNFFQIDSLNRWNVSGRWTCLWSLSHWLTH